MLKPKFKTMNSIKEKIQKLLNLAESAKQVGSIHEAEVATQKALHLLWENGLSEQDISDYKKSDIEMLVIKENHYWRGRSYIAALVAALSEVSLCASIRFTQNKKVQFEVWGRSENLKVFEYLFTICQRTFEFECKKAKKQNSKLHDPSFLRGCCQGLYDKIKLEREGKASVNAIIKSEKETLLEYIQGNMDVKITGKFRSAASTQRESGLAGLEVGKNTKLTTALPAQVKAESNLLS